MGMIRLAAAIFASASALAFSGEDPDRTFVDLPLSPVPEPASAVSVSFSVPASVASVRAVTLHLHSGDGWLSAEVPSVRARGTLRVPFGAFVSDGAAGPAVSADLLRVSFWRRSPETAPPPVAVSAATFAPPAAVAVAGTGPFSDRCARILERIGVSFDRLSPTGFSASDLGSVRVLFLPDASSLSSRDVSVVRSFARRGGRPVVFYSADAGLSSTLGLRAGSWEGGSWSGLLVSSSGRRIPHETENRICPRPGPDSRVLAVWLDSEGRETSAPAVVLAPRGAWFAHVPPRAYPAACDLFRTLLSSLAERSSLLPDSSSESFSHSPDSGIPPLAFEGPSPSAVEPPDGFLVAAWASAPPKSVPVGLGAVFVRAPEAWFCDESCPARKGDRPSFHVWLPCLMDDAGAWSDPADPAVRKRICETAVRLVRAGAAGGHLDYVRTAAGTPAGEGAAGAVTELVRAVSRAVREASPGALVSAAVFPTPAEAASVNQDWPAWVRDGLVDFVSPMIYCDDPETFRVKLDACLAVAPASSLLPGIGTGADESQTDLPAASAQLSACISSGCRGAAFFALDDALRELLPSLLAP